MSGNGEISGDIALGEHAARAEVESACGEGPDGHTQEAACLNCGTSLLGAYCHQCGQIAHVHRTLGAFFHDLLHRVLHFEGKIWRTLPLLIWKPGQLTREYVDGRRARYVSPIALFLFSVFLMFAAIKQFSGGGDPSRSVDGAAWQGTEAAEQSLRALEAERGKLAAQGRSTVAIDRRIERDRQALDVMREVTSGGADGKGLSSGIPAIDRALKAFESNPKLVLYELQSNAYKYSWALIPISVPFIWLLFPFSRRFHLYDHTVFVTYSLSFMNLLAVALTLGGAAGMPWMANAAIILPPMHMFSQLRATYGLSRSAALWRTGALAFIALAALMLFAILVLSQSAA